MSSAGDATDVTDTDKRMGLHRAGGEIVCLYYLAGNRGGHLNRLENDRALYLSRDSSASPFST